ncbi:phosphatase PAP2 family protein [Candidatus Tisiphia endosymbiont of Myopa tessellatipennis]|uniref:phosphatase PAP2 family protein n=1 Tax=Candidatus Tisiphia endosymbiont of Myopa tessellatipennis TaxID=3066257 RepID=UPI00313A8882
MLFNFALKIIFQVPLSAHIGKQGFAFPSGHMQSSVVLYGWLMTKTQSRICKILITGLLFGIGMSLVYFGYHNYFDILGAIFFGSLLIAFYTFLASTKKQILPPVLLTFTTFLMLYIASIHKVEEHLYMAYYALIGVIFSENIFTKKNNNYNYKSTKQNISNNTVFFHALYNQNAFYSWLYLLFTISYQANAMGYNRILYPSISFYCKLYQSL